VQRGRYLRARAGIIRLQATHRMLRCRQAYLQKRAAAVLIQRVFRRCGLIYASPRVPAWHPYHACQSVLQLCWFRLWTTHATWHCHRPTAFLVQQVSPAEGSRCRDPVRMARSGGAPAAPGKEARAARCYGGAGCMAGLRGEWSSGAWQVAHPSFVPPGRLRFMALGVHHTLLAMHPKPLPVQVRKGLKRQAAAAVTIQAQWRAFQGRQAYLQQKAGAVAIQRRVKGARARRAYVELRHSAVTLQVRTLVSPGRTSPFSHSHALPLPNMVPAAAAAAAAAVLVVLYIC
jgi:hypothetical protein